MINLDTLQIVVTISVAFSTILLTVIGLQIIFLLKDFSKIVKRVEKISQGINFFSGLIDKSLNEMESIGQGARFVFKLITRLLSKKKDEQEHL